jgi:hypothetical protein
LRRHLRTLTTVIHPDGETVLFRFYDPVVLNQVMPLLDNAQQARLFDPLVELWADLESGGGPIVHLRRPIAEPPPRGPLRLTQEQIEALDRTAEKAFENELVQQLQQDYPDTWGQLSADVRGDMVRGALAKAREYGLSWESSLTAFLHLMAGVNPNFDRHPVIQAALTRDILPPDERLKKLLQWDDVDVWGEARLTGSPLEWPLLQREG